MGACQGRTENPLLRPSSLTPRLFPDLVTFTDQLGYVRLKVAEQCAGKTISGNVRSAAAGEVARA